MENKEIMRNASKNTIKRVMRQAIDLKSKNRKHPPRHFYDQYHLWRSVGAQIIIMSQCAINNRLLKGVEKYIKS